MSRFTFDAYHREKVEVVAFRLAYIVLVVALISPLLIVISTSFTATGNLTFPPEEFSLHWYSEFIIDSTWQQAVVNSAITATGTMILATFLGMTAAFGLRGVKSKWLKVVVPLALLPLLMPAVVIAVLLLTFLSQFGLHRSYIAIILAHTLWATPLVFFIMQAVLTQFDWELNHAANDLGAGPITAFYEVILPNIKNGIFAAATIAFIISLQEFVMALFLSGQNTRTIPVLAWIALRDALDPIISVVSTLLILFLLVLIVPAALALGLERLAKQL